MIYTYKCSNGNCENNKSFEIDASMKDAPLEVCPICGEKASRVYRANVNLRFAGSFNSTRR